MKKLGRKNIVFTIWYDNLFWCTNKCRFCNLATPMIKSLETDNHMLSSFLQEHFGEIRLLKLMWQEPYDEKQMIHTIELLRELWFKNSIINLTSIGSSVYHLLMKEIGYMTLSFSGYNPLYYGFKSKDHPYKKNIISIIENYAHKIDKVNWIIWKFNLQTIDTDLDTFFKSLNNKHIKVSFLLQKWVTYSKEEVVIFAQKLKNMRQVFDINGFEVFQKEYDFYDVDYQIENNLLENTELTYAFNRPNEKKWYRCTWELTGEHHLKDPELYIQWEYANNCTKSCAWESFAVDPKVGEIFYYKLMLRLLGQFEASFIVKK